MKYLVTGGAGFIGSHLTETLLQKGHEVIVIDDLSAGSKQNLDSLSEYKNLTVHYESVENQKLLQKVVMGVDRVYHLAGTVGVQKIIENPIDAIRRNFQSTDTLLRIVSKYEKPTILASTGEVYGKSSEDSLQEDGNIVLGGTLKLRWSYACSKAMDEFLALSYSKYKNFPGIIVRFFNTVGPRQSGDYGMVIPRFMKQALTGQDITIHGDGSQSRCFCHVLDVVGAIIKLMGKYEQAVGQIFNVGSTEEVTILALAQKIIQITQSKSKIINIPYAEVYNDQGTFEEVMRRVPDIKKLSKIIGYYPIYNLEDILQDTKQYRETQWKENPETKNVA